MRGERIAAAFGRAAHGRERLTAGSDRIKAPYVRIIAEFLLPLPWFVFLFPRFAPILFLTSTCEKHWTEGTLPMIRSELIQKIADENPHLYQRDVERIVNTVFSEITDAMASGNRVELRGFGAFSVKKRDARLGRNPRTGESVAVEEKHVPFFKTGKLLRDRLNGK